jgi:hypothetical protein
MITRLRRKIKRRAKLPLVSNTSLICQQYIRQNLKMVYLWTAVELVYNVMKATEYFVSL